MKSPLTIFLLLGFYFNSMATTIDPYLDGLTERLLKGRQGTIFTCKIESIIQPINPNNRIRSTEKLDAKAIVKIIEVYFGTIDTNFVTLITPVSQLQLGKSYLIYTDKNSRKIIERPGVSPLDNAKTINEENIIKSFSHIQKNKTTGKFKFYNHLDTLIAEGEFKKGVPVNIWNHYNSKGILKAIYDLRNNIETHYYTSEYDYFSNGFLYYVNSEFINNKINLGYSYKVNGQLKSVYYYERLDTNSWLLTNTNYYDNGYVESISSSVNIKNEYGYSSSYKTATGKYLECYSNGLDKLVGEYSNNSKRIGKWIWYNEDGSFKSQYDYGADTESQFEQNWSYSRFKVIGQYVNNKRVGLWTWYNENGEFKTEFDYKNGFEKQSEIQYLNPYYKLIGQYMNGLRVGLWYWSSNTDENSTYYKEFDYKDGKVSQTEYKEDYDNGKIKLLGQCENEKPVGIWVWFDKEEHIVFAIDYKDGTKN